MPIFCRIVAKDLITSVPDGRTALTSENIDLEDDPYFNSYAHFSIHEEMLKVITYVQAAVKCHRVDFLKTN